METTRSFRQVLSRHGINPDQKQFEMWSTIPRSFYKNNENSLNKSPHDWHEEAITNGGLSIRKKNFPRLDVTLGSAYTKKGSSTPNTLSVIDLDPMGGGSESGNESGSSHLHFLLIMISLAFGMENVWRLPTMTLYHGGGFLFVWILMMALVATPLLFLQVWVGSFSGRSCLGVWRAVPLLKGLGVVQLALSCVQAFYYLITGSLAFYYVGQVIASGDSAFEDCLSQPQAESCQCFSILNSTGNCDPKLLQSGESCYLSQAAVWDVKSGDIAYNSALLIGMAILIIITFLGCLKGVNSMGPVVIGLGGLMLLLEMGLFIEGLSRPNGGSSGLRTLFANWGQSLSRMDTWVNATVQSLLSIPLTSGVIIGLAGYSKAPNRNFHKNVLLISASNVIGGLFSVLVTYSWLKPNPPAFYLHWTSPLFTNYLEAAHAQKSGFSATVALLFLAILLSCALSMVLVVTNLSVICRKCLPWDFSLWQISCGICIGLCIVASSFFTSECLNLLTVFDHYSLTNGTLLLNMPFVVGWMKGYSEESLIRDIKFWTNLENHKITRILFFQLKTVPLSLLVMNILSHISSKIDGDNCDDFQWVYAFGMTLFVGGIVLVLAIGIYIAHDQVDYGLLEKLKSSLKSERDWGPSDPILQHQWQQFSLAAESGSNIGIDNPGYLPDASCANLTFTLDRSLNK